MSVLVWLAIPVLVTVLAGLWMSRRDRMASTEQQQQGIDEMERMRDALSRPLPGQATNRRRRRA